MGRAERETRMKIIRRKRTIKIETCSFQQWRNDGAEGNFNCPHCGKTFEPNAPLNAAIAKLLPEVTEDEPVLLLPEKSETSDADCDQGCNEN